jgi:hypothetical protein
VSVDERESARIGRRREGEFALFVSFPFISKVVCAIIKKCTIYSAAPNCVLLPEQKKLKVPRVFEDLFHTHPNFVPILVQSL